MWKKFAKDYLTFSKKDRIGISVLLTLIVITLLAPVVFPYLKKKKEPDKRQSEETVRQLKMLFTDSSAPNELSDLEKNPIAYERPALFHFDPNTATIEQWQKLGIRKNVAATIKKYLSKGGKFRKPDDIRKIYSLSPEDADRLIPFVRIKEPEHFVSYPDNRKTAEYNKTGEIRSENRFISKKQLSIIDINSADTSAFISLPGIGSKLATRIVNFREKLGGFVTIEQVGETRFLPDSTFQKIKPFLSLGSIDPRRININDAGIDELKSHPYIQFNIANAIVQYRTQNGQYRNLEDLRKIHIIDAELFSKIQPYLCVK